MNTKPSSFLALRILYMMAFAAAFVLLTLTLGPSQTASAAPPTVCQRGVDTSCNGKTIPGSSSKSLSPLVVTAGPYIVNTTNDTHCVGFVASGAPACTAQTDGSNNISLRSALEAANTLGGNTTINLPAGTYNLSLGDLVAGTKANTTIYIHGQGTPANTTIHQTTAGRMVINQNYNVNSNVVLQIDNVTISGGSENENDPDGFGGNGGAILAGGSASATGVAVTLTNVTFSGNYCSPVSNAGCTGGAISMTGGGSLTVSNSTFSGNTASKNSGFGGGGAIYFDNGGQPGNVSITNSTFTNNTAAGNSTTGGVGGGVFLAGGTGTTYTVNTNTFTSNAAKGTGGAHGGAIYKPSGTLSASFNYIVGNTSDGDASGLYVGNNAGSIGTATDDWWGCNGGPSTGAGCDRAVLGTINQGGSMTVSPWIVLTNTASPNPIKVNQTTTLTADFLHNSTGGSLTTSQISLLIGVPVTWGNPLKGALSNQQTTIQSNGTATATFTANAAGAGSGDATVDNGTAAGTVTVNKANTTATITSESPDPTVTGQSYTVNFSVASETGSTPTAPTGTVTVSDGTNSCSGSIDASLTGSCSLASMTAGAKTLTATYNGDTNFNVSPASTGVPHTVNKADTTATITSDTPDPSVVGQSVTVSYTVSVNAPGAGTPTGSVIVSDGTVSCTGTVGAGQCAIPFTSAGSKSLTATYQGDSNYNASPLSATASHQVNKADTTTTITADVPDPSLVGASVAVTFTVTVNSPGAGTPTGSVTVSDGTDSCTGTVASPTCNITLNTTGVRTLTAIYAGDGNFNTSTSAGVSHTVDAPPAITSANNTTFQVGTNGSFTVTTTGYPAPTFSETGALPSGVTLTSAGVLSGTPAAGTGGVYTFQIVASNGVGSPATQNFTLTVNEAPAFTSANNTTFTVGTAGSFSITTHGYPTPSLGESGALPSGVTFTDNGNGTGTLAGTPAAGTSGSYSLNLTASNGIGSNGTQTFTLNVNQAPAITSANNVTFTEGQAGTFTVTTAGSPTPSIAESGALPSGVTFTDNGNGTGTLAGTPVTGTQGTYNISFTANNNVGSPAVQTFTLTVNPPLNITSANTTTFTVGTPGSFTVTTIGTPTPSLSESGALPSGVTFTDNGNGTATLAGTPAAGTGGTYSLTLTAHNGVAPDTKQTFTLVVNEAPTLTSANNTAFVVGSAGSFSMTTGHAYPATVTLTESGALPSGVTFTDNGNGTATLAGTPAAGTGGVYNLTFTASNGVSPNGTQTFTLTVNEAPAITSANNTTFVVGNAGSFSITTGHAYPANVTLSESGALPSGVTFTDNHNGTATLAGTPAAGTGGTYNLSFTASNGVSPNGTQTFTLTVNQAPAITSANATTFAVGTAGSFNVTTTGFPKPSLSESGALPSGVTFTDNGNGTATLAGTPAAGTGGTYSLTLTASNGVSPNGTQTFTLTVNEAPKITSANNTTFVVGTAGSFNVTTGHAYPAAVTLSESGALPSGVTFTDNHNGTSTLAGTPAAGTGGVYNLTFTASNGVSPNGTQTFTLTVNEAPAITSANATTFVVGSASSFSVTTSHTYPTPTLTESGALPSGLTFTDNHNGTATLAGTPAAGTAGVYHLTLSASNGVGTPATQSFTLTVLAITLSPATLPGGKVGVSYSQTITATGGTAPYTFSKTAGTLPPGLSLSTSGSLSGKPTTVGTYTFTIQAKDKNGATGSQAYAVTVIYNYSGFFSPVLNPPKLNLESAGNTQPVKFSLGGNLGLNILAANSPASQQINCTTFAPIGTISPTSPSGMGGLQYISSTNQYQYNWKTNSAWKGTCRQFMLTLNDGTAAHLAYFQFK